MSSELAPHPDEEEEEEEEEAPQDRSGPTIAPPTLLPLQPTKPPAFYLPLLTDLARPDVDPSFLIATLAAHSDFATIVSRFKDTVAGTFNSERREELLNIFLRLLLAHNALVTVIEPAVAVTLTQFIVGYKKVIENWNVLDRALAALRALLPLAGSDITVDKLLKPADAHYLALGYAAYNLVGHPELGPLFQKLDPGNVAGIQALVLFMRNSTYSDLPSEAQKLVDGSNVVSLADSLLRGRVAGVLLGIQLWRSLLVFLPREHEVVEENLPLDVLVGLLHSEKDDVREAVMGLFISLPPDSKRFGVEAQLLSLLSHVCEHLVSPTNAYGVVALQFTERLRGIAAFPEIVASLFLADTTARGALIIAAEFGLLVESPELGTAAFPPSVKRARLEQTLDAVQYLASKGPFPKAVSDGILSHLLLIFSKPALFTDLPAKVAAVGPFVRSSVENLAFVSSILIKEILNISEPEIITAFAQALAEVEIAPPERPLESNFCKMFCYLFSVLKGDVVTVFNIARLCVPVTATEPPRNVVELIDYAVPSYFAKKLLSEAETSATEAKAPGHLWLFVLAAGFAGSQPKRTNELFNKVFGNVDVTYDIILAFLKTVAIGYFAQTFTGIARQKLAKALPTGPLANRKKRAHVLDAIRAVFTALPAILEGKTLKAQDQTHVWQAIGATFPATNYEDVLDASLNLRDVFPYIKDTQPTPEQYSQLLRLEFTRWAPIFLAKVAPDAALGDRIVDLWLRIAKVRPDLTKDTRAIAELAFRLSPSEELLKKAIFRVKRHRLPETEEGLPYTIYLQAVIEGARANNVIADPIVYIEFFLYITRFTISPNPGLRTSTIAAIAALFNVQGRDSGAELPPSEIPQVAQQLFTSIIQSATDRFVSVLLLKILERPKLFPGHGLVARALLEARQDFITQERVPSILLLWERYASCGSVVQHYLEEGTLALAARELPMFIPVFLADDSLFHNVMLEQILRSRAVRAPFVKELHAAVAGADSHTFAFVACECLKPILLTEATNELDDDTFAYLMSMVFMWLGHIFDATPAVSSIVLGPQEWALGEVLGLIISRTPLGTDPSVPIDASDVSGTYLTVRSISSHVVYFSAAKVDMLIDVVASVLSHADAGYVMVAGIFYVTLFAHVVKYTSASAAAVQAKLAQVILSSLAAGNPASRLAIGSAFTELPPWEEEGVVAVYRLLVDGLQVDDADDDTRQKAFAILGKVIGTVPRTGIDPANLFCALQTTFDRLPFDVSFLPPLRVLSEVGIDIEQFIGASKLTIENLFVLLGTDEAEVIAILKNLSKTEDIVSGLQQVFNPRELALFGLYALKSAEAPYSFHVLQLICGLAVAVTWSNDKTVSEFKKAVMGVVLPIAEKGGSAQRNVAIGTVRALVQ
jgi:hypothetical protein